MKVALIVFLAFAMYFPSHAQNQGKYKIKIVEHNHKRHREIFYAANDDGLTIANRRGDTATISAENIRDIYINRRGIVGPLVAVGAATFLIVGISKPGLSGFAWTLFGPPIGAAFGFIIAEPFANKRYYRKLEAKDFPLIKDDLRKYTTLK